MKSIRLLLVEDDFIDQQGVMFAVEEANLAWEVKTADTIQHALAFLNSEMFDLIIADYRLGDGTAFDLLEANRQIPIIVVTGFGDEETAIRALRAGAYDYLTKDSEGQYLKVLPVAVESVLRRHRLERDEREQRTLATALRDTALALTSTLELSEVLRRILFNMQKVVPHDRACVMLVEDDEFVRIVQCSDDSMSAKHDVRYRIRDVDHLNMMWYTQKPCFIPDVNMLPAQPFFRELHMQAAYLASPLVTNKRVIGFITVESRLANSFLPVHAELLEAFGAQAAVAIENARLYQESMELAALHERQQIARDLHDSVTQTLFSAVMVSESVIALWRQNSTQIEQELLDIHHLTRGALAEMRTLLFELRPDALTAVNLRVLIQQLLDTLAGRTRVTIEFNTPPHETSLLLPANVKNTFYRITQEALNNIAKHARASHVRVDFEIDDSVIMLRIVDDGRGFDQAAVGADHLGLKMMQERARAAGVECKVRSKPGNGTEIRMIWKQLQGK